jgi:hypothetical protein
LENIINTVTSIHIARKRLGKHISAEAQARNNRTYIARQRFIKQPFSIERLGFLRGPCRGVIKGQRRSFELVVDELSTVVVKKWAEFWMLHSKVFEKKRQERN